ncbi:Cation efflux protein [Dillenia turbinata]|uniref:Cation efflux protein n=1 Tax=Dillenia turbinata TaxID=194707 RepID=A0AAN8ZL75_9MAGN
MENSRVYDPRFLFSKSSSFKYPNSADAEFDRRYAFTRQPSFNQYTDPPHTPISINSNDDYTKQPFLSRTFSSVDISYGEEFVENNELEKSSLMNHLFRVFRVMRLGHKPMKKLFVMLSLSVAYSTAELSIGLLTGRVGLVSDAFHLTFGCGLLAFSLFAMATSREKPSKIYTYGYKRLEVLAAFTNTLFLLFMSFSLAVEALHAFIQEESEHKHYLIVSAVTNLLVNLIGVWFFRNYARVNLAYRNAEDVNYHSVCLHVLADSIRSAGLILASWLLSLGVKNAEVLCLGLVSVAVFMLVTPLFRTTGGMLLQMTPPGISSAALSKCWRQISAQEDVVEVSQARFWELVPGHVIGSLSLQVKEGTDEKLVLHYVHSLYLDVGVKDLTVQIEYA